MTPIPFDWNPQMADLRPVRHFEGDPPGDTLMLLFNGVFTLGLYVRADGVWIDENGKKLENVTHFQLLEKPTDILNHFELQLRLAKLDGPIQFVKVGTALLKELIIRHVNPDARFELWAKITRDPKGEVGQFAGVNIVHDITEVEDSYRIVFKSKWEEEPIHARNTGGVLLCTKRAPGMAHRWLPVPHRACCGMPHVEDIAALVEKLTCNDCIDVLNFSKPEAWAKMREILGDPQ
jgi:hypothetical protein